MLFRLRLSLGGGNCILASGEIIHQEWQGRGVIQILFRSLTSQALRKMGCFFFEKHFFSAHRSRFFFWGEPNLHMGNAWVSPKKNQLRQSFLGFFWLRSNLKPNLWAGIGILAGPSRIPFGGGWLGATPKSYNMKHGTTVMSIVFHRDMVMTQQKCFHSTKSFYLKVRIDGTDTKKVG